MNKDVSIEGILTTQRAIYLKSKFHEYSRRYQHGIFFVLSCIPFAIYFLSLTINKIALSRHVDFNQSIREINGTLASEIGLGIAAVLWVSLFRDAIGGAGFHNYIQTLPISRRILDRVDLKILARANLPFWIMFVFSVVLAPYKELEIIDFSIYAIRLLLLMAFINYLQFFVLRQRYILATQLIIAAVFIGFLKLVPDLIHLLILVTLLLFFSKRFFRL